MPETQREDSPQLSKAIGPWQIMFYGLGSMLGAGIYTLIDDAASTLGNAVWLGFLFAMVAALLTGLSYACVGSRYAKAGGAAYVTQRGLRKPLLSYVVGMAVMMSGLTSMAAGCQAIVENMTAWSGQNLPIQFIAIIIVLLIGLLIFWGIRESMWANIVCTAVEAAGLLFLIAIGMRFWGGVDYLETVPSPSGAASGLTLALIMQGAVLTFFSFIGFEDVLNVSEEVKNPRRNIPLGLIGAMIGASLIYMAVAITAVSVVPYKELMVSKAPLMEVAHRAAPWFQGIDRLYIIIAIFAITNTALLNFIMGSRLLYGMSRQGLLPRILSTVHPKRHTPHIAIVVLFVIVSLLILSGGVKPLAEATVLLLLTVFTIVNISLFVLQRRPGEPKGGFEPPKFIPILGALVCMSLIVVRVHAGFTGGDSTKQTAPLIAAVVIAGAIGLFYLLKWLNSSVLQSKDFAMEKLDD